MSLYNMMNGYNPSCLIFMPMLGRKQDEYPRFRDCFLDDDQQHIIIYTRVGGGNRACGYGEDALYADPNFVDTWDDEYDNTYGYYRFRVPEKWKADFDMIVSAGNMRGVSDEYVKMLREFYPTLNEAGLIDKLFRPTEVSE